MLKILDRKIPAVLICFFLSGAAGLLYQTVWTRQFSFAFGTSSLAVATVLAAYMAGLALGAAIAGRLLHRVRKPLRVYALLELGMALSALAVPLAVHSLGDLYGTVFGLLPDLPSEDGFGAAGFYGVAAFAILLVPTSLMGATLPLLTRYAVHDDSQIGHRIGALYSLNTLGAVFGTLGAAFLLIPALGLQKTVWVGVGLNLLVAAIAMILAAAANTTAPGPASLSHGIRRRGDRGFLLIAMGTGVGSFAYEVLWTRLLEHVLGASVYAFSTMLASFLIGIALGAALATRLATDAPRATRWLAASLLGAAGFGLLGYHTASGLVGYADELARLDAISRLALLSLRAGLLLLPFTLCIGATFPLLVRVLARDADSASHVTATVYSWNTLGAIIGSIGGGFFVIPWLGFENTVLAVCSLYLVLGAAASFSTRPISVPLLGMGAIVAIGLVVFDPGPPWPLLRAKVFANSSDTDGSGLSDTTTYYGVGRSSTVLLSSLSDGSGWWLHANGLPEAAIDRLGQAPGGAKVGHWMAALPALQPGGASRMLVIGFGGGVVLESVSDSVREIDVIELEPEVIEASRSIRTLRARDPLSDARVRIHVNDARGALQRTNATWNAIVSQPSHPWTAGASHLYTREFIRQVRDHLAPGGVFVQWIGLPFLDKALLRTVAATLADSFSNVRIYRPQSGAALFLASNSPLARPDQEAAAIAKTPATFARIGVRVPEDLRAMLVADEVGTRQIAMGAPVNRDQHNLLATRSPLVAGAPLEKRTELTREINSLFAATDPLLGKQASMDVAYIIRRLAERGQHARARRVADQLKTPTERATSRGEIFFMSGRYAEATDAYQRALRLDPDQETAKFRLLQMSRGRQDQAEKASLMELSERLGEHSLQVLTGGRLRDGGDWTGLSRMDDALATIPERHPGFPAALELRVDWRLNLTEATAADAEMALTLIEAGNPRWGVARHAARAKAAIRAGRPEASLASIRAIARIPDVGERDSRFERARREARVILGQVPDGIVSKSERRQLIDALADAR